MMLLVLSLILTPSLFAESIEGTWQGQLIVSPGNELTIQFIIESGDDGYSVTLNSPDSGAIKNVPADTARFENGELTIEVAELSGSFAGNINEGEIAGHWQQLDQLLPLVLKPLLKAELSEAFRTLLRGRWEGTLTFPAGEAILIDMIFKIDEENNVTGDLGIPEQLPHPVPLRPLRRVPNRTHRNLRQRIANPAPSPSQCSQTSITEHYQTCPFVQ